MEADFIWLGFFRKPVLERFISKTIFNLYDIHKHISPLKLFKLNLDILKKKKYFADIIYNKIKEINVTNLSLHGIKTCLHKFKKDS